MPKKRGHELVRHLADAEAALDALVEDVFVLKRHPKVRSCRAIVEDDAVVLYGTDKTALQQVYDALTGGKTVKGRKITRPTPEQLADWFDQHLELPGPTE